MFGQLVHAYNKHGIFKFSESNPLFVKVGFEKTILLSMTFRIWPTSTLYHILKNPLGSTASILKLTPKLSIILNSYLL